MKQTKSKYFIIGLFSLVMSALTGCSYAFEEIGLYKTSTKKNSDVEMTALIDFAVVKEKVLDKKCNTCHSEAGGNKGRVNLETYVSVINNLAEVKADIEDGSMPKGGLQLTALEKKIILSWIGRGAPQKVGDVVPPLEDLDKNKNEKKVEVPKTSNPSEKIEYSYESVREKVIEPKCIKCHSKEYVAGDVDLSTYELIKKNIFEIESDIIDGSMPRKSTLTAEQKSLILTWIKLGAPLMAVNVPSEGKKEETIESDPLKPVVIYDSSILREMAARGKYLFELSSCLACHTENKNMALAGGHAIKSPFGTFYTPNITPDVKTGIGSWTAKDFLKAMRDGKSPSNHYYYAAFPFTNYSKLTDEDILSIWAFIKTLKPIEQKNKPHIIGFPFNQRYLLAFWNPLFFPTIKNQSLDNYYLAKGPFQVIPEKDLEWNRGAYLVESTLHCAVCHTPRNHLGGLKTNQWMGGSDVTGEAAAAPNITPDIEEGLGRWTYQDWDLFLTTGQKPDGVWTGGEMKKLIRAASSRLTPADKQAVIKYLMSLEPVKVKKIKKE